MAITFLYIPPFIERQSSSAPSESLLEYFNEDDRRDQERIHALFIKFAVDEKLVEAKDTNLVPSLEDNMGSWIWMVNWMNFRSLVERPNYTKLMSSLIQQDQQIVNQIINFHNRLGMQFDHRLLNTIVNRIMISISAIPYGVEKAENIISWEDIHKETPFLWILFLLQSLIRSTVKPLI